MNNQQILERLSYALRNVELLAAFQEYDHLDAAIQICGEDFRLGEDSIEWLDYDELLAATGDFFAFSNRNDGYDYCLCSSFYVSSAPLREYYDLCRIHAQKHGHRYQKDPYVMKADYFVCQTLLHSVPYGIWVRISTNPTHEYGNGIAIQTYEDFCGFYELITALLEITEYFKYEVEALRHELCEERKEAA